MLVKTTACQSCHVVLRHSVDYFLQFCVFNVCTVSLRVFYSSLFYSTCLVVFEWQSQQKTSRDRFVDIFFCFHNFVAFRPISHFDIQHLFYYILFLLLIYQSYF